MRTPCPGWLRDCAWYVGKLGFYLGEFMTVKTKKNIAPWTSFAPYHLPQKWLLDPQKMLIPWPQKKPRSWIRINRAWCLGNMLKLKEYEIASKTIMTWFQKPKLVRKPKSAGIWNLISRVLVIKVAPTFEDVHLLHTYIYIYIHIYIYIYHLFPTNYTSQPSSLWQQIWVPSMDPFLNFPSPSRYSMAVTLQPCKDVTPFVGLVGMDVGTGRTDDLSA